MSLIQMVTYHSCFIKGFYMDRHKTPTKTSNQIRRAANPGWSTIKDMGINHGRFYIRMLKALGLYECHNRFQVNVL